MLTFTVLLIDILIMFIILLLILKPITITMNAIIVLIITIWHSCCCQTDFNQINKHTQTAVMHLMLISVIMNKNIKFAYETLLIIAHYCHILLVIIHRLNVFRW